MTLDRLADWMDRHKFVYRKIKKKSDINIKRGHGDIFYNNLVMNEKSLNIVNTIYMAFDGFRQICKKPMTDSGGISTTGVNILFPYYWVMNVERGFFASYIVSFDLFVYLPGEPGRLYAFTVGQPRREIKSAGGVAMKKLLGCARAINFDLTKYREKDVYTATWVTKPSIAHPLIRCLYPLLPFEYGAVNGVCHLDLNESYRGCLEAVHPEFKELFAEVDKEYPDHQENKDIINMSIGMFQSKYMGYMYSGLAKTAIDGTRQRILDISKDMSKQGYLILGYNTDGIWYRNSTASLPQVYHGEGEGTKPWQFKTDYIDCLWVPLSKGGNWCVIDGLHRGHRGFWKALRGNFAYAQVKEYEQWDCWEDVVKAMESEEVSIITFEEDKGWKLTRERISGDGFVVPKVKDVTFDILRNKEQLEYEELENTEDEVGTEV